MSCSPPRERDKRRRADVVPITPDASTADPDGPVTRSTLDVLTRAERATTPSGQVALALARRIDKAADSGSSLAAIIADGTYKAINDKYFDFDAFGE